uniref:Uncharacterized protein n=1 Tax=Hanusia phi TaxID=3032 RepID=A0A7S0I2V4_9CRYP|mmetsp:Transcript_88/g.245  ORF Transcript_88/g.245 Transcript_88/m.245 type:complete len:145 (+) Transcript_88:248-682(+)
MHLQGVPVQAKKEREKRGGHTTTFKIQDFYKPLFWGKNRLLLITVIGLASSLRKPLECCEWLLSPKLVQPCRNQGNVGSRHDSCSISCSGAKISPENLFALHLYFSQHDVSPNLEQLRKNNSKHERDMKKDWQEITKFKSAVIN